ncbi:hypothetical protein C8J57DRAFT_1251760 [Mycena rebaudengoi]|nr:hypothetical protein C8J57DRAFT_1251760 [Mycena rebaudengoi]
MSGSSSRIVPTPASSAAIFESSWSLHNVQRSTFSLGGSSVPLAKAPLKALSPAGDSTMFGGAHSDLVGALCHSPKLHHDFSASSGAHSALVEALCHSPKLHHVHWRCLGQVPELYPLQHLQLQFLSQAGNFTMFGGKHSSLVEALCHLLKLHQEF